MAHPSRADFVPSLDVLNAGVTWDEKGDRWDTGRRAWLALAGSTEEWSCVIQDDAILCRNFTTILPEALDHAGGHPVSLYAGNVMPWKRKFRSVPRETSWVILNRMVWGPGLAMPTRLIPEVIAHGDRQRIPNYDLRLSKWFERHRVDVYYTWPSLVDHRDSPSLVAGRTAKRHAFRFLTNQQPDWTLPPHRIV